MCEGPWAEQIKDRRPRLVGRAVVTSGALNQWAGCPGEWETQPALTAPCTHTDTPPLLDPPSRPPMGSPVQAPASFGGSMGQAWAWELSV